MNITLDDKSLFRLKESFLVKPTIKFIPTQNYGAPFSSGLPDTIIFHHTATTSISSVINTFTSTKVPRVSAHILIDRNGNIFQFVPFNIKAWHAGESNIKIQENNNAIIRSSLNNFSIGIELLNEGSYLKKLPNNLFQTWYGSFEKDGVEALHKHSDKSYFWQPYTPEQLNIAKELTIFLIKELEIKFILGHDDIAPSRKIDPGPLFPLAEFQALLKIAEQDLEIKPTDSILLDPKKEEQINIKPKKRCALSSLTSKIYSRVKKVSFYD